MTEKQGVVKYVGIMKKLFVIFSCIALPIFMVSLVFAFARYIAFFIIAPAILILYFVVYGFYAMRVSMGTVIGIEITDKVVHLKTKRKTFTYDVKSGCVSMTPKKNYFVGTFRTQDSQDRFLFYRHVPFTKYYEEQFTFAEMQRLYPALEEE